MRRDLPTAPIAAAGLIAGYGVAVASGSRTLGGAVLAGFGLACMSIWLPRDGVRTTAILTGVGLAAFALSHVVALLIGAWPAVLVAAAAAAVASWRLSDSRRLRKGTRTRAAARTSS
jgi:hypothetical protein